MRPFDATEESRLSYLKHVLQTNQEDEVIGRLIVDLMYCSLSQEDIEAQSGFALSK